MLIACALALAGMPCSAVAGGRIAIQGIRMVPQNHDAETFTRPGWGGALEVVSSFGGWPNWLGASGGLELINLLSDTVKRVDPTTLLRTELNTDQVYGRLFVGPQVGPRGRGFLQPYAGAHLALVLYSVSTTLAIPDDTDPEKNISQDLGSDSNLRFGYDLALGLDLNIRNRFVIGGGVRYVKSFGVPQQLDQRSAVTIYPDYFQAYVGVGITLHSANATADKPASPGEPASPDSGG